jgi:farnesyl-diphosphate farnesyltransferase
MRVTKNPPYAVGWDILPGVSRSFALVIRWLPRGLDDAVMTAYLLCRVADTLEDAVLPVEDRRRMLARFAASLDQGSPELPAGGYPAGYKRLLDHVDPVLAGYRALPPRAREAIAASVREMCEGMSKWCGREIRTLDDQNQYCYYVAGLVGRMLTALFHAYGLVDARLKERLDRYAVDFGLALQKVNVIRDIRGDLSEGRCFWPEELIEKRGLTRGSLLGPSNAPRAIAVMDDLIRDAWRYTERAVRYMTLLPVLQWRLRIFCAIPLFMAVATLGTCWKNPKVFQSDRPVKITSRQTRWIIVRSLAFGPINRLVESWYRRWRLTAEARPRGWPAPALRSHAEA